MLYCFDCLFRAQVEDLKREILSAERDFRSQVLHLVFWNCIMSLKFRFSHLTPYFSQVQLECTGR